MKIEKKNGVSRPRGLFFAALLAVILAVLFGKSLLPGYVHFSNDGPLGQQNAAWRQLPTAFTGSWYDINDLGSNAGAMAPAPSTLLFWVLGPVGYAKFLAPLALFILGLGAWGFFRQLKLAPLAAVLGALAAVLNSTFFATACWGVAPQQIAIGMDFLALALVVSNTLETPVIVRWARLALAGLAVGVNVMEAADIGAIFSVFVAAFVFFRAVAGEGGAAWAKVGRGISRVAVIALFAGFIAAQTIVALVGAAIVGIAGTAQATETKAQHWYWATSWSEPKMETLGLFVPGLFGYKLDTPDNMMGFLQDSYQGGRYWGTVGSDPLLDPYFEGGRKGPTPPGQIRFTGGQNYSGILVALLAFWAVAQSLRRQNSVFNPTQKRFVWFWSVVLVGSLLLAYGRFAPFYQFFYMLPYASTIRCPTKFLLVFSWAIVILFAYGIHGLSRRYLEIPAANSASLSAHLKNWWAKVRGFDRNWTCICAVGSIVTLLGWLIYAGEKPGLVRYLQTVGFGDENLASQIAAFSIRQAGWFVPLFTSAAGLCVLTVAGVFAGRRARLGGILLGLLLVGDLGRADLPYIIHWDYKQKYDIDSANPANSTNPIINFLREKPYEHRVANLPFKVSQHLPLYDDWFGEVYLIEWAQHHFPYYNIQSLDKIQMPRMPADLMAYEAALSPRSADTVSIYARHWELTNTRYLLGAAGYLDVLNEQLDPAQHRFRIFQRFDIVPKPGIEQVSQLAEFAAAPGDGGALALFEFTGALPRASLYSNWQICTNDPATLQRWLDGLRQYLPEEPYSALASLNPTDQATLKTLTDTNFDPAKTVLLSAPLPVAPGPISTNANSGTVKFKSYAPTDIVFDVQAAVPSVLLLNDKFDPGWRVFADGKPAELLRCNFIMRGVYLTPGAHTVEFQFSQPNKPLYITLAAIGVGILLCGFLIFSTRRNAGPTT
ncbi:MAG: hypothetical protein ABSD57_05500 [Verrucomicrobiota bacterium]|jgi:hypothetical protein